MDTWKPAEIGEHVSGNCPDKVAILVSSKKNSKSKYLNWMKTMFRYGVNITQQQGFKNKQVLLVKAIEDT